MMNDSQKKMSVLVVDDDETIIKLYTAFLEGEGHRVSVALTGERAIEVIGQDPFELVILDLKLPDMDGTTLLDRIKDKIEWVPVIIVTANPTLESSIEAIHVGIVTEYIIKPFNTNELMLAVRRALEQARLKLENKRLINKLERTNLALTERVEQLEQISGEAVDYEKKIAQLSAQVKKLGGKLKPVRTKPEKRK